MLKAVIIAGGSGERFWPKSRRSLPKQLLPITGGRTMLDETVERLKSLVPVEDQFVVTGEILKEEIKRQIPSLPDENIIAEPSGRNTAAAVGLAAVKIGDPDAIMIVLPSDHLILDEELFLKTLSEAGESAADGDSLITIGIKPQGPATGYGYIKVGEKVGNKGKIPVYKVERFIEKPARAAAEKFLEEGKYLWNSGMFIWKCSAIMDAFKRYMPSLYTCLIEIGDAIGTADEEKIIREKYESLEKVSIDYGVMEKADNTLIVEGNFRWDDVGSWLAMERIHKRDGDGNVVETDSALRIDTRDCIIVGDRQLIATVGLKDLIIISTQDALLVCDKSRSQEVKALVQMLKEDPKLSDYL